MLPTSTTCVTKTIPSYLYFQYQNDPDLPALINAYNTLTQNYLDWFNNVNLPVYTQLTGPLLDWIGRGIYGLPRPTFAATLESGIIGQIGSVSNFGSANIPNPNIVNAIASTKVNGAVIPVYGCPDDVYQRVLTWWFYKGDGSNFSVQWLKRRIYRFLYGINGTNPEPNFTPNISVTFDDTSLPLPTCNIEVSNLTLPGAGGTPAPITAYFQLAVEQGVLLLPFRFNYNVVIIP